MHIAVKSLGDAVQSALKSVGYGARDIEVIPQSSLELNSSASWKGARGFVIALDLRTGQRIARQGEWGGANPFVRNAVDESDETYVLPEFGVVIKGQTGHPRTFARIYVHPAQMAKFLPAPTEELSPIDQQALYCFKSIKGGEYRRQELARRKVTSAVVDSLVERGYLSRNKAGATSITTAGKNAIDGSVRF